MRPDSLFVMYNQLFEYLLCGHGGAVGEPLVHLVLGTHGECSCHRCIC